MCRTICMDIFLKVIKGSCVPNHKLCQVFHLDFDTKNLIGYQLPGTSSRDALTLSPILKNTHS